MTSEKREIQFGRFSVDAATVTPGAYRQAGCGVLSAALNDSPRRMALRSDGSGYCGFFHEAAPEVMAQVHLAGLAAEDQFLGRPSLTWSDNLTFAILVLSRTPHPPRTSKNQGDISALNRVEDQAVEALMATGCTVEMARRLSLGLCESAEYEAVEAILNGGCERTDAALRAEVERLYKVARESLVGEWPSVVSVAEALLAHTTMDRSQFLAALKDRNIYASIHAVQDKYGIRRDKNRAPAANYN